jgi:AcrR family transcriptional regulator
MSESEPSLRERKKAKLRAQIVMTALYLFQQRGYHGTRVADITDALEISQPTFFRYFPSKDAVLHEIFAAKLSRFRDIPLGAVTGPAPCTLEKMLMVTATSIGDWVQDHRELTAAFIDSGGLVQWISWREDGERSVILEVLEEALAHWQRQGLVDKYVDPKELAEMVVGTVLHLIRSWLKHESAPYDLTGRLKNAARVWMRGIEVRAETA